MSVKAYLVVRGGITPYMNIVALGNAASLAKLVTFGTRSTIAVAFFVELLFIIQ